MDDTESIPDQFMLFLSSTGFPQRACRVVWRNERQLGVKFKAKRAGIAPPKKAIGDPAPSETAPAENA